LGGNRDLSGFKCSIGIWFVFIPAAGGDQEINGKNEKKYSFHGFMVLIFFTAKTQRREKR